MQTFEKCSIYTKSDQGPWESGKSYLGGSQRTAPDPKPARILKAINVHPERSAGSCRSQDRRSRGAVHSRRLPVLVIFGEESGNLMAADATTGKPISSFPTNQTWRRLP